MHPRFIQRHGSGEIGQALGEIRQEAGNPRSSARTTSVNKIYAKREKLVFKRIAFRRMDYDKIIICGRVTYRMCTWEL